MTKNETRRRSQRYQKSKVVSPEPVLSLAAGSTTKHPKAPMVKEKTATTKATGKRSRQNVTARPSQDECRYAATSLSRLHPEIIESNNKLRQTLLKSACRGQDLITDSVVHTMLSQNTTDANKNVAWARLKESFPSWDEVAECKDIRLIENAIKVAGLAKTRAERMQTILRTVKGERGEANLEYIRHFSDQQIKTELSRFKGLGPKTISCVLLFSLGRDEFPVDTHVLRIAQKMGWISSAASREQAYGYLNDMIPNDIKMDLHCLLVRHGKVCHRCAANERPQFPPTDGSKLDCPLAKVSSWAGYVPIEQECSKRTEKLSRKKIKVECIPDVAKSKDD